MTTQPIPFSLRLPEDIRAWIEAKAAEEGRSLNRQILQIIKAARAADHSKGAAQ